MVSWNLKSAYRRVTLNKITLGFFLFSFVLCLAQGIIESILFSIDAEISTLVTGITRMAQVPRGEIAWLTGSPSDFQLQICLDEVPLAKNTSNLCRTIFESRSSNLNFSVPQNFRRHHDGDGDKHHKPPNRAAIGQESGIKQDAGFMDSHMQPSLSPSGQVDGVNMAMPNGSTVFLDLRCTRLLVYPEQRFREFVREDVILIVNQFWLAGLSFFAIMYESVPHLLSVLAARALMMNWSGFSLWRANRTQNYVQQLVSSEPCNFDAFPMYFQRRIAHGIVNIVLNAVGLIVAAFFSYRLYKLYTTQAFKSFGAPKKILRIYRIFLAFFVCLQLSVFFFVTSTALWIDQLLNGAIRPISSHTTLYLALFIASMVILIPWTMMGWFSVRHEMRKLLAGFFAVGFVLVTCWAIMFSSLVFRWTFVSWDFFASLLSEAFVMVVASCITGVICWRNFDRGLAHYLYVEGVLSKFNFQPAMFTDEEKYPVDEDLKDNGTGGVQTLDYK